MRREGVHLLYTFLLICYQLQTFEAYNYQVGILYGETTKALQASGGSSLYKKLFNDAAQYINENGLISDSDRLSPAHYAPPDSIFVRDSHFETLRAVCNTMINGKDLYGVIVPDDMCGNCGGGVGAMVGDVYSPTFALDEAGGSGAFKMMPTFDDILEMLTGVVKHFHWTDFIFIYDDDPGYALMHAMLEQAKDNGWQIIGYGMEDDLEAMFEDLMKKKVKNILFFAGFEENILPIRDAAFKAGAMKDTYHWIFGNVGAHGLGQEDFLQTKLRQDGAYITRFKPETAGIQIGTTNPVPQHKWPFRQNAAYDAMLTLAAALKHYGERTDDGRPEAIPRCGLNKESDLVKDLTEINIQGLTGELAFNPDGDRINYTINIYSGKDRHNILKAGQWTQNIKHWEQRHREEWPKPGNRLNMQPFRQSEKDFIKILCIEEPPFLFTRDDDRFKRATNTNEDFGYQGYIPDLLEEIKKVFEHDGMDFTYKLELMSEGNYGRKDSVSGQWDGMIQELIEDDADVATGALTKTGVREDAIDFTDHFMKSDIKILIRHPNFGVQEYPFVVVFPFHRWVWFTNLAFVLFVTALMWAMSRWNPYEWRQKYKRNEASQEEGDTFGIRNTFWYIWSTLMWQRYTRGPRSHSGRILSSFWFYFVLVMVFMYGLHLNPFLKVSKNVLFIRSMADLLKLEQTVHYGVVRRSPTYDFFKHSKDETIQNVWAQMAALDRDPFVPRLRDGVRRVRRSNGRYALISEEKLLLWEANDWPCTLYVTGGTSTRIKYALAVPSGSPLRDQLTYAIKKLKKEGILGKLEDKHWQGTQRCANQTMWKDDSLYSLNTNDLMGLYYVFLIGITLSIIIFFLDWVFAIVFPSEGGTRSFNRPQDRPNPTIQPRRDDMDMDDFNTGVPRGVPASPKVDQGGGNTDWI